MAAVTSSNKPIRTYGDLIEVLKEIGVAKKLSSDESICNVFSSVDIHHIYSHETEAKVREHIIALKGITTIGDIVCDMVMYNEMLLFPEWEGKKFKKDAPAKMEVAKLFNNKFSYLLSLLDANPQIAKQEVKINVKNLFEDHIIPEQKKRIYMWLIGIPNPEAFDDYKAYKYCAQGVEVEITKIQKTNGGNYLRYWFTMFMPDGTEEHYVMSVSSTADRLALEEKVNKVDAYFKGILKSKNII